MSSKNNLCQVCLIDLICEDNICVNCLGIVKNNVNLDAMEKPLEISDWKECFDKVVKTVESCTSVRELVAARKLAVNFFNTFTIIAEDTIDINVFEFDDFLSERRGDLSSLFVIQKSKIDSLK